VEMAYYNITIEAKERKLFKGKEKEGSIFRLKEKLSRGRLFKRIFINLI